VSRFQAIQKDISQYFPNEEEATKLAAEVMKEYNQKNNNPNVVAKEITVDDIVQNAMDGHKRKVSQFRAIKNDLGLMFNEDDVNVIAKDAMKAIFAQKQIQQKQAERKAKHIRKESVKPPNLFGNGDLSDSDDDNNDDMNDKEQKMKQQIDDLKDEIKEKNEEIKSLKNIIRELTESKTNLAINSNKSLNQMREYLLAYQQSMFPKA